MNIGKMMKNLQQMQAKMEEIQAELEKAEVEATAGGGMVKVVVNGKHEIQSITIDPEVVDPEDVEMLQDLVIAAVNNGLEQIDEAMTEKMQPFTGGLDIPGM